MPTDRGPLWAVSPLDGRYEDRTAPLAPYVSEAALMRARVQVEVEYTLALARLDATSFEIGPTLASDMRVVYKEFEESDAQLIKDIETTGARGYTATNHDVKAVEYFLREATPEFVHPWLHFGLTSEDVTNLAYRLLVTEAMEEVLQPRLRAIRSTLGEFAQEYADIPMLARTHGQPATPTTFGKEMAVYASRLGQTLATVEERTDSLAGKLGGASGTFGAHTVAFPDVDWAAFARSFVTDLGLEYVGLTTQINPGDDFARLFDALAGVNHVLIDLDQDIWQYVSRGYLGQEAAAGETGSSTMPHKVNPIDFENSEGNLSKANSDLDFLADSITTSRMQRDLTDSTVKRNIGAALAHAFMGYTKLDVGLEKVVPRESVMREDLQANPAVIGEAIQTVLRRDGHPDAYELVKDATRGESITMADFESLIEGLDVPASTKAELRDLRPEHYTGIAADLARDID
ncbi:MAG: adenylosuccinate lyase [Halodesulfurarchaeum sp.]|nr:adenylosuccinate lyase [Halodesulfurarchaeum sp.]